VRVFAFTCGWLTAPMGVFLGGEKGQLRVPVPCFLVDHPRGLVLFDSGLHPAIQRDPQARIGTLANLFRADYHAGEDVAARLAALEIDVRRVRHLVLSHLHFDHAGGLGSLPEARIVVQRPEWEAGADPDLVAANAYQPHDYRLGHDVHLIDGEHDLFGDGRIVCLPTPGHTPGHQSLRLRLDEGELVLTADACYLRRTLDELLLPPIVHDPEAMRASLLRLGALRDAGARLVFGHDPALWATVPQAPAALT